MKNFSYLIIFCFSLTGILYSCADQLDIKPTSELENEYFESELRIQQGVGACYALLTGLYSPQMSFGGGIHAIMLLPGDDVTNQDTGMGALEAFSGLNSTTEQVSIAWTNSYQIVYRANFMLEKIEEPDIKALYERSGLWEANKGELLFIRSWVFYRLWDWFRKAPIQEERVTTIADAVLPPSKDFEMLDRAIADLEIAAGLLPAVNYWAEATEKGRIFNESAYALLVKCYVLRARYNSKSAEDYQKAIAAFEKITTRKLVNFEDNFDYHFENNDESLFEFQASHNFYWDNPWLENDFGGGEGQMGAMYHYCTEHWSNYVSGIYGPTAKLVNAYEIGDPRKESTAAQQLTNVNGDVDIPRPDDNDPAKLAVWNRFDGYQLQKYVRPAKCWFEKTWGITSTNNTRLIRYADIKLLAAESYLQTGDQTKALAQVNDIRQRARESTNDGTVSAVPASLASVTINDIMDERFRELAAEEGIRWTDLRSWHAAGYIDLSKWTAADFGYNYDAANFEFTLPKHLLFPIPQKELDSNPLMAASGNNPGY